MAAVAGMGHGIPWFSVHGSGAHAEQRERRRR
jgi:hypothetical protein